MRLFLFAVLLLLFKQVLCGQCTNTSQWPSQPVAVSAYHDTVFISVASHAGDYAIITQLEIGETYTFTSTAASDYFSIRDIYDSSILLAHGATPLTYSPSTADQVALHINLSSPPCGTESLNRVTAVQCTSCPGIPPVIGIETNTPKATLDVNGEIRIGDSGRTPVAGTIRWNVSTDDFEGYNGSKWISLTQGNKNGQWGTQPIPAVTQEDATIRANEGEPDDNFGISLAIDGDYAIAGSYLHDIGSNTNQGAAYVYRREAGEWTQQAKLTASDGSSFDQFGYSVAIHGDYCVVGSWLDNIASSTDQGSVYVYKRELDSWVFQQKLIASDGSQLARFGESVAIKDDIIVVGGEAGTDEFTITPGAVYVFERSANSWTQSIKITASDGDPRDGFGHAVAMAGSRMIVGAPGYEPSSSTLVDLGAAYIYRRLGSTWSLEQIMADPDGEQSDFLGTAVDISSTYAIAGASGDDTDAEVNVGSAIIYMRSGSSWSFDSKVMAIDGSALDQFGSAVSVDGSTAVISSSLHDVGTVSNQGAAYIFAYDGESWQQRSKLVASNGAANDRFGRSVCIDKSTLIVGATLANAGGFFINQGAVYIFYQK